MTPDRNKTHLTNLVTTAVVLWLDEKGFKPVETEVPVAMSWVADVAAIGCLTRTECKRLKLLPKYSSLQEEDYRAIPSPLTVIVEVKTTRADFRKDLEWFRARPADLCFLAAPPGVINDDELPMSWGLLQYADNAVRLKVRPVLSIVVPAVRTEIVHNVAVRRDHFTRHARMSEVRKQQAMVEGDSIARSKSSNVIQAVLKALKEPQKPLEEIFRYYGEKLPSKWLVEEIEKAREEYCGVDVPVGVEVKQEFVTESPVQLITSKEQMQAFLGVPPAAE